MRVLLALLLALPLAAQQPRLASDFEILQMEKQLAGSRAFEAQFSARLNLGDVRRARNESALAQAEFERALALAEGERVDARRDSELERYARATAYSATVHARLGDESVAFQLLEEAVRYTPDDPYVWNTYASSMRILDLPQKAIAAGRNAVAIAEQKSKTLDLAVFQYSLATSLLDAGEESEGEKHLLAIIKMLRSREFDALRKNVARSESFEVHSFVRGDVAAYVSLLNRAQLHLAGLYERKGDLGSARLQYERVLEGRSDDVIALSALARLARSDAERERRYAEAFAANPFSMTLVREYQDYLRDHPKVVAAQGGLQLALQQLARGEMRTARTTLDALLRKFPQSETLRILRDEAEGAATTTLPSTNPTATELRALLDTFERLTPDQRVALDQTTFTSIVAFSGISSVTAEGTAFESGTIDNVLFRFNEPTVFAGTFDVTQPLRLTYRILGITQLENRDALLLEPIRLEAAR